MRKKLHFVLALLLLIGGSAASCLQAQEVWSLQRCIAHAVDNNLTLKQAQANVRVAQLAESQARASRLPSVNASVSVSEQFGRTIDPTSNSFVNTAIGSNQLGINASLPLYAGGRILNTIRQSKWDVQAAEADAAQSANTLALQVAQAYLSILLAREQVESAQNRVSLSQKQLTNTQKLIDAGNVPLAEKYTVLAQIARDEQAQVQAVNSLELAYLNLRQLLQLEPDYPMQIETPQLVVPSADELEGLQLSRLYQVAKSTQPNIAANGFRIKSAESGIDVARSGYLPSVSLFGNLNSFYSTQFTVSEPTGNLLPPSAFPVQINGQTASFAFLQPETTSKRIPYFDQLDQTFGQGIGVSLNIPIYQNGSVKLSVERARLGLQSAQLQDNQAQQQLKSDIQTALNNARAARRQLDAAQKSYDANQVAYMNMEKRQALGAVNTLELNTAKNNLDIAENDLIVAKYDYYFKVKILDFYQGKAIVIN
jgi:outer membrane protein